jgi:hypothetical protein
MPTHHDWPESLARSQTEAHQRKQAIIAAAEIRFFEIMKEGLSIMALTVVLVVFVWLLYDRLPHSWQFEVFRKVARGPLLCVAVVCGAFSVAVVTRASYEYIRAVN